MVADRKEGIMPRVLTAVLCLLGCSVLLSDNHDVLAKDFYVAANGSDANPGTKDRPFATLEGARDTVRAQRKSGALANEPVVVLVAGGIYRLTTTFELTAEDSGTPAAPWSGVRAQRTSAVPRRHADQRLQAGIG